jgi:uncharacterized membrane protein
MRRPTRPSILVVAVSLDLALMVYPHTEGAERAYSDVRNAAGDSHWVTEVAFVEHHRHDRLVVRGTVAGHYVDADDHGDVVGSRAVKGAVTGAAVGLIFGPAGMAVGLTAGGMAGGVSQSDAAPHVHSDFFDEVRAGVPVGSSALALLAAPEHVDEMVAALDGSSGELARHHLTDEQAQALVAAVADDPSAA